MIAFVRDCIWPHCSNLGENVGFKEESKTGKTFVWKEMLNKYVKNFLSDTTTRDRTEHALGSIYSYTQDSNPKG